MSIGWPSLFLLDPPCTASTCSGFGATNNTTGATTPFIEIDMKKLIHDAALFVFEGADGAGKTTLVSALAEYLDRRGVECVALAFPGTQTGSIGKHVHELHHNPLHFGISAITPSSFQLLHVAAHLDAIERTILPALRAGKVVLLDRYLWSTLVYGGISDVPAAMLQSMAMLELVAWQGVKPTTVFLMDRPGTDSALVAAYAALARRESDFPVEILANTGTVESLRDKVLEIIAKSGADGRRRSPRPSKATPHLGQSAGDIGVRSASPAIYAKASPPKPSKVYDTYWRFAAERQEVFFRQVEGIVGSVSSDPILLKHKFTNAYRASDRVSQYLISNVIYENGDQAPREIFFRTILFKLFNRIDTWELLKNEFGEVRYSEYRFENYDRVLTRAIESGARIYSAAYIMPAARAFNAGHRKHAGHLRLLEAMLNQHLSERLSETASMQDAFNLLRAFPMLGDFLAFQFVTDLNYSTLMNFSEQEFVVPGPGARDGIRKCFSDLGEFSEADVIRWVMDRQSAEFDRVGVTFKSLWGRPLQLIDCQNLFCETSKYARLAHPDVVGLSGRTRIKQMYRPTPKPIAYWYPPKWGINEKVNQQLPPGMGSKAGLWG
ncbi:Thymidylate kinase [Anaerolineales bacterium]|nr:Thymidylate kinase [Anaerolineales bacterium]